VAGVDLPLTRKKESGRHEETRTPDLYRVKNEVATLNPFACFAFRFSLVSKRTIFDGFGDELVTSVFPAREHWVARLQTISLLESRRLSLLMPDYRASPRGAEQKTP
jgi:hypothetical protein